jgi:signal transduction histidine kinase
VTFELLRPLATAAGDPFAPAGVGYLTVLCAFLAASGALRLSRSSARVGTALAVVVYLIAAFTTAVPLVPTLATVATLAALGTLGGGLTVLVRRVVTDQLARVELSRMYAEARQAIDAREEVLKIVSHDLRNPLSTISMSAQLMLETPLPEPLRVKQLTVIQRSTERMNRLIQDLLDVARFESGRLGIDVRPLDVPALLAEAEETLRPLAAEKQIALDASAASVLPVVSGDQGRVLQLLGNVVGNAIKFTPMGGRIAVRAEDVGGVVRFAVADTGPGIPESQLPHVFGRLWQANRADRRGIGLGLAISKGIVEAHGGRIWVESRVGQGTTFYFTLGGEGG